MKTNTSISCLTKGVALGLILSVTAFSPSARAATVTWNNTGTDFNTAGSWTGGLPGVADTAQFGVAAQSAAPNVSGNITVNNLTFSGSGYTLTSSGGAKLTLATGGTSGTAITVSVAGTTIIGSDLVLGQGAGNTATFAHSLTTGINTLLSGNISESGLGTKINLTNSQAGNTFTFSGNNTYTGTTTINANTNLNINSTTAIGTGALVIATGSGVIDNTSGSAKTLINNNGINLTLGNLTFTGSNDLSFGSGVLTMSAASRTATVNSVSGSPSTKLTIGSIDADTAARTFTKAGVGTLAVLNAAGANFQGGTTLSAGTLLLGNKSALGTGALNNTVGILAASTDLSGANSIANTYSFSTGSSIAGTNNIELTSLANISLGKTLTNNIGTVGGTKLTISGNITIDGAATTRILTFNGSGNTVVSGNVLHNSVTGANDAVIYNGSGTLTFAGSANTHSNGTTVEGGTMVLSGLYTGTSPGFAVSGGNLILDLTAGNDRWSTTAVPTLRGGTLTVKGAASGTSSQTLASPDFSFSQSKIVIDPNGGSGTTLTLGNTWTGGGSVVIDLSASGAALTSSPTLTNSLALNGQAIVKDSTGIGFATRSAGGTGTSIVRYTSATALPASSNLVNSTNYIQTNGGAVTLTGSNAIQSVNTLQFDSTTAGNSLDLNGKTLTFPSGNGAFLMTGTADYTISNGLVGTSGSGTTLRFHQYGTGALNISAGINLGAATLNKNGSGLLNLTGTTNHTGVTNIRDGALQFTANQGNLGTGNLTLTGGVIQSSGTFSRALGSVATASTVRWTEAGALTGIGGGFSAQGGVYNIQIGGGTGILNWEGTNFVTAGKALIFGSTSADNLVDFQNDLGLGSFQREIIVVNNASSTTDIARLSGVISSTASAPSGLLKTGGGVLELTNANTYSGTTTVAAGILRANNTTGSATGTGTVLVNSGASLGGTGSISGDVTVSTGATIAPGASVESLGVGNLTINGGTLAYELNTATNTADLLFASDSTVDFTLTGSAILSLTDFSGTNTALTLGTKFTLFSYNGTWNNGIFSGYADDSTFTLLGNTWLINYNDTVAGSNFASDATSFGTSFATLTVVTVPEPSTYAMVGMGLLALWTLRRKSGKKA